MRSRVTSVLAALTVASALTIVTSSDTPAAYPTSTFYDQISDPLPPYVAGYTSGGFIWYNRSVGVQGHVVDYPKGISNHTEANFFFNLGRDGNGDTVGYQTRTANDGEDRSFNFPIDGSPWPGGINSVSVVLCTNVHCGYPDIYNRP